MIDQNLNVRSQVNDGIHMLEFIAFSVNKARLVFALKMYCVKKFISLTTCGKQDKIIQCVLKYNYQQ